MIGCTEAPVQDRATKNGHSDTSYAKRSDVGIDKTIFIVMIQVDIFR